MCWEVFLWRSTGVTASLTCGLLLSPPPPSSPSSLDPAAPFTSRRGSPSCLLPALPSPPPRPRSCQSRSPSSRCLVDLWSLPSPRRRGRGRGSFLPGAPAPMAMVVRPCITSCGVGSPVCVPLLLLLYCEKCVMMRLACGFFIPASSISSSVVTVARSSTRSYPASVSAGT